METVDDLLPAVIAGDPVAWEQLWLALEPRLSRMLRSPRTAGRLSASDDDRRSILVEVMARLRDDQFRRLEMYRSAKQQRPGLSFTAWLGVVTRRVAVDYMRGHAEYIDRRRQRVPASSPGKWVDLQPLVGDSRLIGDRPAYTNRGAAMKMLRYAYTSLAADQLAALELWIVNTGFADIARQVGAPDARAAERLVRAALERLRRQFRERNTP
jgi:DNA-directed RNA polymerase specialized sigma24 family protein